MTRPDRTVSGPLNAYSVAVMVVGGGAPGLHAGVSHSAQPSRATRPFARGSCGGGIAAKCRLSRARRLGCQSGTKPKIAIDGKPAIAYLPNAAGFGGFAGEAAASGVNIEDCKCV